jgi:hypothetical protein
MSSKDFLSNSNVQMLWEIILDQEVIQKMLSLSPNPREKVIQIRQLFESNLSSFSRQHATLSLVELNKTFVLNLIHFLRQSTTTKPKEEYKKIKIFQEEPKTFEHNILEPVTFEEIQNERAQTFENDYQKRQQEFSTLMKQPNPPVPKFSEDIAEKPKAEEMAEEIKKIQEQRKYDLILQEDMKKHIHWASPISNSNTDENDSFHLFEKLKKVSLPEKKNDKEEKDETLEKEFRDLKEEVQKIHDKLDRLLERM